jgi:DNA polymerase-3 subunit delta
MKLDGARFDGFLRDPGKCRVVLLYGEDAGLIADRAQALVRCIIGPINDPFRLTDLERDGINRIEEEMTAMALTGGRRVVRVRDVTDAALKHVQAILAGRADSLLILEAPSLARRAKLVAALEKAPDAVAVACYALEGRALEAVIKSGLQDLGATVTSEALTWLGGQLGADRAITQREIEKLATYVGPSGTVDIDAARLCVGDLAGLSLDDALFAATSGDIAATDRALELAMQEGTAPVGVLRGTLMHLQRLQRARAAMSAGQSPSDATDSARPPVFFKSKAGFTRALGLWSEPALEAACTRIWEAERACKRTGAADEAISRSAVIGLAQRAAIARRR